MSQHYLKTSIGLTTNRGVASWGEVLDETTVGAMLDRLLHRGMVLNSTATPTTYATTTPRTAHSVTPRAGPADRYSEPAQGGEFR